MPKKQPEKPVLPGPTQKVKDNLEALRRRNRTPIVPSYMARYFYVFGFTPIEQKKVLLGPCMTEDEAEREAIVLDIYKIFELKTRDLAKASREIKAKLMTMDVLGRGKESADEALKRLSHKRKE